MKPITYLKKHIEEFVSDERIIQSIERLFEFADQRGKSGFEKWLQFELALFFLEKNVNPVIEKQINVDGRKGYDKGFMQMDLVVELKKEESFGIELKVRRKASGAKRALSLDMAKHDKAIKREKSKHCFALVLFGETLGENEFRNLEEKYGLVEAIPVGKRDRATVLIVQEASPR